MAYLIIIIGAFAFFISPTFRILITHPISTVKYATIDTYKYFKEREYNVLKGGRLRCYEAHFGGGKTLSMVHDGVQIYKAYNNKLVYDAERGKFVTQKVLLLSNVELKGVPYQKLESLAQVLECAKYNKGIDLENDTRTCVLVLGDEFSVMLNSREFKTNITPDVLNSFLTCRHYHLSIFYTSQKFKLVDALLRTVTQEVIWCRKWWRCMVQYVYDADEREQATNPSLVEPLVKTGFFIKNKDFDAYDTYAVVDTLEKAVKNGDMRTEEEILIARGQMEGDLDQLERPSKKLRKRWKRKK